MVPEPKKRPKSSYLRFAAELPNERWQSDFIHWQLASGTDVEIVSWLDDHSRYALSVTAHPATLLLDQGISVRVVQEILGHSQLSQTERYTHVTRAISKHAADRMSEALWAASQRATATTTATTVDQGNRLGAHKPRSAP